MKEIPLTNGGVALVDDEDYNRVVQYRWGKFQGRSREWYAKRYVKPGLGEALQMHRFILKLPPRLPQVDHINFNGLDNRKENLRVVTQSQNKQNGRGAYSNSRLGVRGVSWDLKSKKYRAYCQADKHLYHLGFFSTLDEAEQAAIAGRKKFMTHSQN